MPQVSKQAMKMIIDEAHVEALSNVQNRLIQTLADAVSMKPEVAAWDKVSWGRKSSSIDHLGRPETLTDELEIAADARIQQIQQGQITTEQ